MDIKVEPTSGSESDTLSPQVHEAPDTDNEESEVSYVFPEVKCEIKVSYELLFFLHDPVYKYHFPKQ
jgi:hypothetical protein